LRPRNSISFCIAHLLLFPARLDHQSTTNNPSITLTGRTIIINTLKNTYLITQKYKHYLLKQDGIQLPQITRLRAHTRPHTRRSQESVSQKARIVKKWQEHPCAYVHAPPRSSDYLHRQARGAQVPQPDAIPESFRHWRHR